jgi:hypothetical protein
MENNNTTDQLVARQEEDELSATHYGVLFFRVYGRNKNFPDRLSAAM